MNPIEMAFSKIKAFLKDRSPQSFQQIVQNLGQALADFDSDTCSNLFRHANYVSISSGSTLVASMLVGLERLPVDPASAGSLQVCDVAMRRQSRRSLRCGFLGRSFIVDQAYVAA